MDKSSIDGRKTSMRTIRLFFAACLLASPGMLQSQATVTLDQLSDCEGLEHTVAVLKSSISRHCRNNQGPIEHKLMSQFQTVPNMQTCILADALPQLSGFTCIRIRANDVDELTCFRAIGASALDDYVNRYDSVYAEKVARYEKSAKGCSVGNGHFAVVDRNLFPGWFESIGNPRFGFAIGIDTSSQMHGVAYHGFADVDPDLTTAPKAIEIFDVFQTDHIVQVEPDVSTEDANLFKIETEDVEAAGKASAAWLHN